ncbi:hypothetical protein [Ferrimicrobium sp.]|uniref:hypothetical protein n=1 Tax=Ferrimicrobium sp. TaxID=2926050 RepID=UPI00261146ED|nr:hypothetical protein [Ferrimicrobium sp.]
MASANHVRHPYIVDKYNLYQLPLHLGDATLALRRPSSSEEWGLFFGLHPDAILAIALDVSPGGPTRDPGQTLQSKIGSPVIGITLAAPDLYHFWYEGNQGYAMDMASMLAAQYPNHVGVVIGEDALVVGVSNGDATPARGVVHGWGSATLWALESLLGSATAIAGASVHPLDGCLSAVSARQRVLVGVSATTDTQVLLAAAIFDCAATIFHAGNTTRYVVTGWAPVTRAIAADLAVLCGDSVLFVEPASVLSRGGLPLDLDWGEEVMSPVGPLRLLRRTYADWVKLGARLRESTESR